LFGGEFIDKRMRKLQKREKNTKAKRDKKRKD